MDASVGTGSGEVCSSARAWVLRGLCTTGLGISGYLAWTAFQMQPVFGCGSGSVFDCSHVLNSKWSKVGGIPVSVPAFGLYAALLGLLAMVRRPAPAGFREMLWKAIHFGFLAAGSAALWFIGLQMFVLEHYCPYCLVVHTCSLILAGTALFSRTPLFTRGWMSGAGLISAGGLIAVQALTPEEPKFEVIRHPEVATAKSSEESADVFSAPGEEFEAPTEEFAAPGEEFEAPTEAVPAKADQSSSQPSVASSLLLILPVRHSLINMVYQDGQPGQVAGAGQEANGDKPAEEQPKEEKSEPRKVTVGGNRITLNVAQWPMLGKPDAPYLFVEMFDYTCPHCRNTHKAIKGAQEEFGDDLAIVALPVPLESSCNRAAAGGGHHGSCEMSRIAVAVWRVDASKFREFHDWMFESSRTPASAKAHAEKLVGAEPLRKELDSQIPNQYIKRHVDLYVKVGSGSVPKIMFPSSTVNGEIQRSTLCSMIRQELKPAAVAP